MPYTVENDGEAAEGVDRREPIPPQELQKSDEKARHFFGGVYHT